MKRFTGLIFGLCLLAPLPAAAYLDYEAVHTLYQAGNFEVVIRSLERYMDETPQHSRADSIFIAKHLAVIYAANPRTVEKGRIYMNRLLAMLPAASLLDMYVSEEIDRIFVTVRKDFVQRQEAFGLEPQELNLPDRPGTAGTRPPPAPRPNRAALASQQDAFDWPAPPVRPKMRPPEPPAEEAPEPEAPAPPRAREKKPAWLKPVLFIAGGVGLAAAGTLTYLSLHEDPAPAVKRISVTREPASAVVGP